MSRPSIRIAQLTQERNMNRNRFALILGVLVCLTGAVAAFDVTETTDYPGGFSFTSNPSVGTLDPGSNTVSGSLSGNCVTTSSTLIDCNPGTVATGDTQDSFLLTVPTGSRITSLTVTTSAVSGPAGLSASLSLESPTAGNVLFTPFLSPPITPAQSVTNLINLVSNPNSGLALTAGQINSLTDKLNSALASIQAGLNAQAINQLQAFINSVQSSLKTGKISAQTASTLTSAANAIIAML